MPKCQVGWRVDERPRWPTWTITRLPDRRQMRRWCRPIREGTHRRRWLTCGRATRTACTGAGSTSRRPARGRSRPATRPWTGRPLSSDMGRGLRARCTRPVPRPSGESIDARSPFRPNTQGRWWFTPSARWGTRVWRLRSLRQEERTEAALSRGLGASRSSVSALGGRIDDEERQSDRDRREPTGPPAGEDDHDSDDDQHERKSA